MRSEGSCVGTMALVLGMIASIVAILGFFYTDADTFFREIGPTIDTVRGFPILDTVRQFVAAHPATIWVSALVVCVLTAIVTFFISEELYYSDIPSVFSFLASLPFGLVWLWVFSDFVSLFVLILFSVGFLISFGAGLFLSDF